MKNSKPSSIENFHDAFSRMILDSEERELPASSLQIRESGIGAELGATIYQKNHRIALTAVLDDVYEATKNILGVECFGFLTKMYVLENSSSIPDLNQYGEFFSDLIKKEMSEISYLSDVTSLEWRWHRLYYGSNHSILTMEDIERVSSTEPGNLFFQLNSSLQLSETEFPVTEIWRSARQGDTDYSSREIQEGGELSIVWRKDCERQINTVNSVVYGFLQGVQAGHSYGEIAEELLDFESEKPVDKPVSEQVILEILAESFQKKWITGVTTTNDQ